MFTILFRSFILCRSADVKIDPGIAYKAIPRKHTTDVKTLPITVIGYISPYPTVVKVITAHQSVVNILVNTSGCA